MSSIFSKSTSHATSIFSIPEVEFVASAPAYSAEAFIQQDFVLDISKELIKANPIQMTVHDWSKFGLTTRQVGALLVGLWDTLGLTQLSASTNTQLYSVANDEVCCDTLAVNDVLKEVLYSSLSWIRHCGSASASTAYFQKLVNALSQNSKSLKTIPGSVKTLTAADIWLMLNYVKLSDKSGAMGDGSYMEVKYGPTSFWNYRNASVREVPLCDHDTIGGLCQQLRAEVYSKGGWVVTFENDQDRFSYNQVMKNAFNFISNFLEETGFLNHADRNAKDFFNVYTTLVCLSTRLLPLYTRY